MRPRVRWTLKPDGDLDHHPDVTHHRSWSHDDAGFLRVERQVTVPFADVAAALFLIRTYLYPFDSLAVEQRETIANALKTMPSEAAAYKGFTEPEVILRRLKWRLPMKHSPGFLKIVDDARVRVRELTVADVKAMLDRGEAFHLIDVREESEWLKGHLPRARHFCKGIIERDIEDAISDHAAPIVLYCGGGYRSALAADNLQKMGYTNVASMDGGWRDWNEAGYPTDGL